jgi:hypothetical protein
VGITCTYPALGAEAPPLRLKAAAVLFVLLFRAFFFEGLGGFFLGFFFLILRFTHMVSPADVNG